MNEKQAKSKFQGAVQKREDRLRRIGMKKVNFQLLVELRSKIVREENEIETGMRLSRV